MFYASSHRLGDGGHYVFDLYVLSERACVLSEAFSNLLAVELSGILERKKRAILTFFNSPNNVLMFLAFLFAER